MITPTGKIPDLDDTIVALSSAAGTGARAVVRLSGRRAAVIAAPLCPGFETPPVGYFFSGEIRLPGFHAPIPADIYHFAAPRTYTGQDVIEIHTISCQPIVEVLIAECLRAGARAAQPGEFTMRAFMAGKLDLTRAEAVLGVIEADNRADLKQALAQLAGGLAGPMHALREDLLNLLADVEAGLDFADENIHFVATEELLNRIARGLAHLTLLQKQIDQRSLSGRPFRVVLAGKPNAGKSSLFNAIFEREHALTDPEPGTTRDYLERIDAIDDVPVLFVDTAGLRASGDAIEQIGQRLAHGQVQEADLVLWCAASDDPEPTAGPAGAIRIATKADLAPAPTGMLATSAVSRRGIDELRRLVAQAVRGSGRGAMAPSLSRCGAHIHVCLDHLRQAYATALNESMPELLAMDLRLALEDLGAMAGAVYTDDLLDRIFSRFCIGK